MRLPTFWSAAPELWFAQAEASFKTWNPKITSDQTKYHYLLQALPQDVLMEFEQAVTDNGPERYVGLKWALIKVFDKSIATKNAEPLELSAAPGTLSNKKPSAIMMKIRNLSRSDYAAMERAMFLNQLTVAVHTACLLYTSPSPRD